MDSCGLNFFPKKLRYGLIVLMFILMAGYGGLSVFLNSTPFRFWIVNQINKTIDGRLIISGHRLALLSGRLALFGVQLVRNDGRSLLRAERLEIKVMLMALLQRRIHLLLVALEKPHLTLDFDSQDRLQLIGLANRRLKSVETQKRDAPWSVYVLSSHI